MSSGGRDSSRFPVGGGFLRGLPFWLGAVIVSFVPTKILSTIDYVLAPPQGIGNLILDDALFLSLIMLYFLYAMRYITRRIDRLGEYVKGMNLGNTALHLGTSHRLSRVLLIWIILLGISTLLSPIPSTIEKVALEQIPVFAYFFLILALFLWTYGSSMLAIYRAGKLPFRLKPFTEDRTLGLKPFGTASMRLASVYAIFPITWTFVELVSIDVEIPGGVSITFAPIRLTDIIFSVGLILTGIVMFFLPLLSIRERLQEAKRQELSWVTPRYTTIITRVKEQVPKTLPENGATQTQALADELTMVRQIQQHIQMIQSWPFDCGVVSRLATVLVIPPILGVLARILILVFLHL